MSKLRNASYVLRWGAIVWLVVFGLLVIQLWPNLPQSVSGWLFLAALGPPLYVFGEAAADKFWRSKPGSAISNHPSPIIRVLLGVLVIGVACVLGWTVLWILTK